MTRASDLSPGAAPWRTLFRLAGAPRVALILALMLVTSLTEGIGLLLLVPVLQSLDPGTAPGGVLGRLLPGRRRRWRSCWRCSCCL